MHSFKLSITGIIGILTFHFQGCMISGVHTGIPTTVTAIRGQEVALTCYTETFTGNVTWIVSDDSSPVKITTCLQNEPVCGEIGLHAKSISSYNGTRNANTSILKIITSQPKVGVHECRLDDEIIQSFELVLVNRVDIQRPTCHVEPQVVSDEFYIAEINFTCGSFNKVTNQLLMIYFDEESAAQTKSTHVTYITDYATYVDSSQGSCEMSIEGLSETWSCVFPTHVGLISTTKGTDVEFECRPNDVVDGQISWGLLEPDGVIDIANRSWIRGGGRSMLLREMTTDDHGRVVQCFVHQPGDSDNITFIGFYQIKPDVDFTPTSSRGPNENNAAEPHSTTTTYRILFAFFFILWLLTVGIFLAWVVYPRAKAHWQLSTASTYFSHWGKEQSTRVREGNAGNGQGIPVTYVEKKSAVKADEGNSSSNNNASSGDNSIRITSPEPVASTSLQPETSTVDNPLYFCVDRSSPPSLRSQPMSDEENHNGVSELDLEGYDIVGESDHATFPTFSNEQNDYAEVTVGNNPKGNADSYLYGVVKK